MNVKNLLLNISFACTSVTMLTDCSENSAAGKLFVAEAGVKQAAADTAGIKKNTSATKTNKYTAVRFADEKISKR